MAVYLMVQVLSEPASTFELGIMTAVPLPGPPSAFADTNRTMISSRITLETRSDPVFALGAGYWALRIARTSAQNSLFIFWLGIYCTLSGNVKNNGLVLIPAGAMVVLLVSFLRTSKKKLRIIFKRLLNHIRTYRIIFRLKILLNIA